MLCIVRAGSSEGLAGPRVLEELIVGVATPSDLAGSFIVKILHCSEGENVEQVARISKQFSRVCDCSSLSLSTYLYLYLAYLYHLHLYMLDIYLCSIDILS